MMQNIDETILTDTLILKKTWECPHCGEVNRIDGYANKILIKYFKVIRQCPECGYLHYWKLRLTDDFKKSVIKTLEEYNALRF